MIRAGEFVVWITLALCLAALGGFDALSRLLSDHNNFDDGNYLAMAAAWLVLAAWAAARSLDSLSSRSGIRRRWFIALLLLAALPYPALFESDFAFTLNACLLTIPFVLALTRVIAKAPPLARLVGPRCHGGGIHGRGSPGQGLFINRTRVDMTHLGTAVALMAELGLETAGTTLVDVGANIGTTTMTARQRYGFTSAVALEPAPASPCDARRRSG